MYTANLIDSLCRHIGETVTIFTSSGGLSGSGFTGVLAGVSECSVKLITCFGQAPTCPLGSSCTGYFGGTNRRNCGNILGSVTEIPTDKIVSFTHNAV
ncbi:MAG: hypothetical protein IJR59_03980 [Firmicutes bacterium]|nr:hypothetical protein [Bacillota bacterium]